MAYSNPEYIGFPHLPNSETKKSEIIAVPVERTQTSQKGNTLNTTNIASTVTSTNAASTTFTTTKYNNNTARDVFAAVLNHKRNVICYSKNALLVCKPML